MDFRIIARWETRGKDWLELRGYTNGSYSFSGRNRGGCLGIMASDKEAIERMEAPWGKRTGAVTVLKSDRPSLKRIM